jgi:acyl-CoA reductase-like NAD-dependent aldehyde dehydrogenase
VIIILNAVHPSAAGRKAGTLFLSNRETEEEAAAPSSSSPASSETPVAALVNVEEVARGAREGSRLLQDLKSEERSAVLLKIALLLEEREQEILAANSLDLIAAEERCSRKHFRVE